MQDMFDLERFPLDQPKSAAWAALVARCRQDLAREGMYNLEGFLRPDVASKEVLRLTPLFDSQGFRHERRHNIYFTDRIDGLEEDHPALARFETSNLTLCADQIVGSALLALYEWPEFAAFLAATMDKTKLCVMEDPLARVNVMSYGEGQALNWHFDRSEFTTTLLLQAPEAGGAFEYRTNLRGPDDPNYEGVAALLEGRDPERKSLALKAGTLNVFRGLNTAHRVSQVKGGTPRMIAVFAYFEQPGVAFSAEERLGFYGRAAPF